MTDLDLLEISLLISACAFFLDYFSFLQCVLMVQRPILDSFEIYSGDFPSLISIFIYFFS